MRIPRNEAAAFAVAVAGALSLAKPACADTKMDGGGDAAFQHRPKAPTDKVQLQLEDVELKELARVIGEMTGKQIVVASEKLGKVHTSVYSATKLSVGEAYHAFLAVLQSNGLTVLPESGFYKIVESQDVARQLTPIEKGELPHEERYVTRIHRLAHLSAEEVATDVLSKLATKDASVIPYPAGNLLIITETAANLRRMLDILSAIDDAGEEDRIWMRPLKYVPSSQVEKQLGDILDLKKKQDVASKGLHVAKVVALDRPNALVVVGTKASYERASALVDLIDVEPSNEAQVHVVMLQHSEAKKVVGPLNEALGNAGAAATAAKPNAGPAAAAVLDAAVKIAADETTNSLIVTATNRDFAAVRQVIAELDRPKRQVYIEAVVLDVSTANGLDISSALHGGNVMDSALGNGSQTVYGGWRPISSAVPSSGDLQAFALGVRGPDIPSPIPGVSTIPSFGGLLTALAQTKGADILSTPHIMASDNTVAEIRVQLQTSLQPNAPQTSILSQFAGVGGNTAALSGLTGALPNTGVTANYQPIGPKIKVTPHLNDSDEVRLDIDELISDVQSAPDKGDTYGTISYLERSAKTTLTVKDGETIVIGGLVRNRTTRSESKVPILGDIPLLGLLFKTRTDQTEKSNLLLVLTPHIIRDREDMKRVLEQRMHERQELIDRELIFDGKPWSPPRDWRKAHGLLGDIRGAQRDVDKRREEEAALNQRPEPTPIPPPLDLPVPQGPGARPSPGAASPGAIVPARPGVVEK